MKKILFMSFFMALNLCVYAQNTFKAVIKDSEKKRAFNGRNRTGYRHYNRHNFR